MIPASATPLTFTESTDFSNSSPGAVIGALDVNINTISGSINAGDEFTDYFQVTLPSFGGVVKHEIGMRTFKRSSSTRAVIC